MANVMPSEDRRLKRVRQFSKPRGKAEPSSSVMPPRRPPFRRLDRSRGPDASLILSSFALVAACLVQKLSPVVVYVDPEVRFSIAVSELSCFLERFAVLPQWSARPCECVNWIQSYYPILTFRCLYLHHPPRAEAFFNYPNVETEASIKVLVKLCRYAFWKKIFSYFSILDVP